MMVWVFLAEADVSSTAATWHVIKFLGGLKEEFIVLKLLLLCLESEHKQQ